MEKLILFRKKRKNHKNKKSPTISWTFLFAEVTNKGTKLHKSF